MKFRTTIQLGALAVLLGSALYIADEHLDRRHVARVSVTRVFDITTEPVNGVGFERDGLRVECVRRDGNWFLQVPMRARANTTGIERIVAALEALKWQDSITREQRESRNLSFADYGLAPGAMKIMLDAGGRREVLLLGDLAPFGGGVYGRVNRSDAVVVLPESVLHLFPDDIAALRERTVLFGNPERADRLDIYRRDAGFLQLVRHKSGWMLQQPIAARADAAVVQRLLNVMMGVQVARFHWDADVQDDDVGEEGLRRREMAFRAQIESSGLATDAARARIAVWTDGDRLGQELFVGRSANEAGSEVFARPGGVEAVYTIPAAILEASALEVEALRDRTVFHATAGDIGYMHLQQGETRIELQRRSTGGWRMRVPVQALAARETVEALINRTLRLRVLEYLPASEWTHTTAFGLAPPQIEIEAGPGETRPQPPAGVLRLQLGNRHADGKRRYARLAGNEEVFMLAADGADDLGDTRISPLTFRDRVMLAVQTGTVYRIQIVTPEGETRIEREAGEGNGQWRCTDDRGAQVDPHAVQELLAAASRLEAERFVAFQPGTLDRYGLDTPAAVITFGLRGADGIQNSLLLGQVEGDEVHAMIKGHDFVFTISTAEAARFTRRLCTRPQAVPPGDPGNSIQAEGAATRLPAETGR